MKFERVLIGSVVIALAGIALVLMQCLLPAPVMLDSQKQDASTVTSKSVNTKDGTTLPNFDAPENASATVEQVKTSPTASAISLLARVLAPDGSIVSSGEWRVGRPRSSRADGMLARSQSFNGGIVFIPKLQSGLISISVTCSDYYGSGLVRISEGTNLQVCEIPVSKNPLLHVRVRRSGAKPSANEEWNPYVLYASLRTPPELLPCSRDHLPLLRVLGNLVQRAELNSSDSRHGEWSFNLSVRQRVPIYIAAYRDGVLCEEQYVANQSTPIELHDSLPGRDEHDSREVVITVIDDGTGVPIEGAIVSIISQFDSTDTATTDMNGVAVLAINPGFRMLRIVKANYAENAEYLRCSPQDQFGALVRRLRTSVKCLIRVVDGRGRPSVGSLVVRDLLAMQFPQPTDSPMKSTQLGSDGGASIGLGRSVYGVWLLTQNGRFVGTANPWIISTESAVPSSVQLVEQVGSPVRIEFDESAWGLLAEIVDEFERPVWADVCVGCVDLDLLPGRYRVRLYNNDDRVLEEIVAISATRDVTHVGVAYAGSTFGLSLGNEMSQIVDAQDISDLEQWSDVIPVVVGHLTDDFGGPVECAEASTLPSGSWSAVVDEWFCHVSVPRGEAQVFARTFNGMTGRKIVTIGSNPATLVEIPVVHENGSRQVRVRIAFDGELSTIGENHEWLRFELGLSVDDSRSVGEKTERSSSTLVERIQGSPLDFLVSQQGSSVPECGVYFGDVLVQKLSLAGASDDIVITCSIRRIQELLRGVRIRLVDAASREVIRADSFQLFSVHGRAALCSEASDVDAEGWWRVGRAASGAHRFEVELGGKTITGTLSIPSGSGDVGLDVPIDRDR